MSEKVLGENGDRILLVTKMLEASPKGGRELLCKMNYDALCSIYGARLVLFELPVTPVGGLNGYVNFLRGQIDGLSWAVADKVLSTIKTSEISKIFIDGSNLGWLAERVKKSLPRIQVIVFFHNVESRFFLGSLRLRRSFRALAVLIANYVAERRAVRWADKRVCLSERDSRLLTKVYGRGATHIAPMALEDKLPPHGADARPRSDGTFALFVGGTFYANRAGVAWFVREVVPRIQFPLMIVGRGFEDLRNELEVPGKVTVVGGVESLAEWYRQARFVIAPIFDGSGMKTKVAEALMHGKKVVGTTEAFSGYEDVAEQAGWVCSTAEEFAAAVSCAEREVTQSFDSSLRALYEHNYSFAAATSRLARILAPVVSVGGQPHA